MNIREKREQDLFADSIPIEIKEKKPTSPLTLDKLQAVTVHYELFSRLMTLGEEKKVDYLIFKRIRNGRYATKNKCYYTIVATKRGTPRARQVRSQTGVIMKIDFPMQVNYRRGGKQYRLLQELLNGIIAFEAK